MTMIPRPDTPIYFDIDDIEHRKVLRTLAAAPVGKGTWLRHLKILAIIRAEKKAVAISRKTFVCSKTDRMYLEGNRHPPKSGRFRMLSSFNRLR